MAYKNLSPGLDGTQSVQGVYAQWTHQPVVLQVTVAALRVSLRGTIIGETQDSVRFRITGAGCTCSPPCKEDHSEIQIYKSMILAVEEDCWMDSIT